MLAQSATASAVSFGRPPIDYENLLRQVIQSNTSVLRTIGEYPENSEDNNATRIDIEIFGKVKGNSIEVTGVEIKDDGDGMSLTKFGRNFRGYAWLNDDTHFDNQKYGKNCIGAKSGLDFFQYIDVTTTTREKIEEFPDPITISDPVEKELYEEIAAIRERYSKLITGDDDTERRKFRMSMLSTSIIEPWETCDASEHGTTVYLNTPVPGRAITIDVEGLKKHLRSHFRWLSEQNKWNEANGESAKKRKRGMFLKLPESNWEQIMPFDNGWASSVYTSSNPCGAYLLVTGSLSKGLDLVYTNPKGEIQDFPEKKKIAPISLTPEEKKAFRLEAGDIDVWLQLTYGLNQNDRQLLISISGSNVDLPYELSQKITHGSGFSSSIRGKIDSSNSALKAALRHNRTKLDMSSAVVNKFWDYIYGSIFSTMAFYYGQFMQENATTSEDDAITDALSDLKFLFQGIPGGEHKFNRWQCLTCDHVFDYPIGKRPISCPKCSSPNLDRYHHPESTPTGKHRTGKDNPNTKGIPKYEIVPSLGNYIPMRYNASEEKFELVDKHPEFTQDVSTKTVWSMVRKERIIHHALTAWVAHRMTEQGLDGDKFLKEYAQHLKSNYLNNHKRKKAVEKVWESDKTTVLRPFVSKTSSSFE